MDTAVCRTNLVETQVLPLDHSRVLLLPPGKPPELVDLKRDSPPGSLPEIGSSANVLGWFGTNILCHWNGTNQILVRELRGAEFIQCGAITLDSGTRPAGFAYNATRQLLAWTEGSSSASVFLASLATPGRRRRTEERCSRAWSPSALVRMEITWRLPRRDRTPCASGTSKPGRLLHPLMAGTFRDAAFAAGGRVLVVANRQRATTMKSDSTIWSTPTRRRGVFPGETVASVSGGFARWRDWWLRPPWVASVRLFDPAKGELIESVHGHLNAVFGIAFSPDGRRLISAKWRAGGGQALGCRHTAGTADVGRHRLAVCKRPDGALMGT